MHFVECRGVSHRTTPHCTLGRVIWCRTAPHHGMVHLISHRTAPHHTAPPHVINLLKPGVMFKNIYQEAKGKVLAARPDLLPRLVSNFGHLTGLEVRDSMAQIDENSERSVEAGNIFVISAGFDAASTVAGQQPWGVALAQTVLVAESGAAQVLTGACSSKPQWWYY